MSEELIQKELNKQGIKVTNYEYYNIGATTISQLKNAKIVPSKSYGKYSKRKPDGLLVDRQNKSNIKVIVVIENKQPSDFRTNKQKINAIEQCNDLCQELNSNLGVITDGQVYFWINPKQENKENNYLDRTTSKKRSYSFIRNGDEQDLTDPFIIRDASIDYEKLDDDTRNTIDYIIRIIDCVDQSNSKLKSIESVDPLGLAKKVWQDIYINTGKDPTKCLYNVVELFIFKFLSDLNVLTKNKSFKYLNQMYGEGYTNKEVLEHYATTCRKEIRDLFPIGDDGTTIINGTIFVNQEGKPVESQANLFKNSIQKYAEFGSLKHIQKEFKTKLFETFLKQSQDKSRLGQFFTPRKVVKAVVNMADIDSLPKGARVCDPFCGVGGFLLEPLHKTRLKNEFIPKNGKIKPKIKLFGFDKGLDNDEARTIILAKANMLIYLSEIVEKYPRLTKEFAKLFNDSFHLLSESNLGTLKEIYEEEEEKFDLIITNPPYITSGVSSIRDEIKSEGIEGFYTQGGKGVEGLAIEWILRSLKKGGKAFIIIPDSILTVSQNKTLRKYILKQCYINCVISLPVKTFFNTPKKTYILGIEKKRNINEEQNYPVFTYLVSNIGESLNVDRFEIAGRSDLEKAKDLFNQFKGAPETFDDQMFDDKRCKLQPISRFDPEEFWMVEKWWTDEEKVELGVMEEEQVVTIQEFKEKLSDFAGKLNQYKKILDGF